MIVPGIAKSADSVAENNRSNIVANWKFTKQHVKSGSIDKGNLIIEDTSKHGNDLELVTIGDPASPELKNMIQWSEEDYHDQEKVDSLKFANYENAPSGRYFKTNKNAPINSENFDKGFTIEAIFKLPSDSKSVMGLFLDKDRLPILIKWKARKNPFCFNCIQ